MKGLKNSKVGNTICDVVSRNPGSFSFERHTKQVVFHLHSQFSFAFLAQTVSKELVSTAIHALIERYVRRCPQAFPILPFPFPLSPALEPASTAHLLTSTVLALSLSLSLSLSDTEGTLSRAAAASMLMASMLPCGAEMLSLPVGALEWYSIWPSFS